MGVHKVRAFHPFIFQKSGKSTIITFALECGVPSELIQSHGDWKSDTYKKYLVPSFQHRQLVMNGFAQALFSGINLVSFLYKKAGEQELLAGAILNDDNKASD
jgi:hypothetical protein